MVDQSRVSKGRVDRPPRILIYGFNGIGKTKFATGAEDAFVIDADKGSHKFDARRVEPWGWDDAREWVTAVEKDEVKCKTLVLDSVTELEAMSHAAFFGGEPIGTWNKGYGRGDEYAILRWRELLQQLERIWKGGRAITFVAHAAVKRFEDPGVANPYDRFEVSARPKLAGLLSQWCDYVLFAALDVAPVSKDSHAAVTSGARYVYTRRRPAWDAKARGTMLFPEQILLSYSEFDKAVKEDAARAVHLKTEIDRMLAEISDAKLSQVVQDYCRQNPDMIVEAHNRVSARFDEVRRASAQQSV